MLKVGFKKKVLTTSEVIRENDLIPIITFRDVASSSRQCNKMRFKFSKYTFCFQRSHLLFFACLHNNHNKL